jgi:hypothetical protein
MNFAITLSSFDKVNLISEKLELGMYIKGHCNKSFANESFTFCDGLSKEEIAERKAKTEEAYSMLMIFEQFSNVVLLWEKSKSIDVISVIDGKKQLEAFLGKLHTSAVNHVLELTNLPLQDYISQKDEYFNTMELTSKMVRNLENMSKALYICQTKDTHMITVA